MKNNRLIGILLTTAAVVGMIFGLLGLFEVWYYKPVVAKNVSDNLALLDQTLKTTEDALVVADQALQTTTSTVASLQDGTQALAKTIHDTGPMLDSLSTMAGKDLPAAIKATQTSLASAQSSALLIDNILGALTSIPFSPVGRYNPEVPLHTALANVSTSLDTLPASLATISTSINSSKTNLSLVEQEVTNLSGTVSSISDSLRSAQDVLHQYQTVTVQLKQRSTAVQKAAPGWITGAAWLLTFLLVWFMIAQLGLWVQGLEMLHGRGAAV
jgi:septal ring factor EnvC (AmiA/AmiB activator)